MNDRPAHQPVNQPEPRYAGERLGLPQTGPGSVASWLRRVAALFIDWVASLGVATVVSGGHNWQTGTADWYTPTVFLVEVTVLTALLGGSFGQLATRLAVVRLDGGRLNVVAALVRSLLILLVIPPLVFNRDNRGLHDLATGSVCVER